MIESLETRIAPATFLVTTLADADAGSLRQAIADANASLGPDTIIFKKGLTGFIELTSGAIQITDTLSIKGPGPTKLGIDQQATARIFEVRNVEGESPLTVSGLTFFGGESAVDDSGGAIISTESLKVINCVFKNNTAGRQGGAIAAVDGSMTERVDVEIRNSVFTGNSNGLFDGGAVSISVDGAVTVKGSTFVGNASDTRAGALGVGTTGSLVRIEGCQFLRNRAPEHGALGMSLGQGTDAIIRNNVFTGNQASEQAGGAIAIFGGGEITFDRNIVSQNTSFLQGGGMITGQFTALKIIRSQFLDNAAQLSGFLNAGGGAISIGGDQPDGSTAQIISSVISGNSSTRGGGIYVEEDPFLLKIIGTKITGNRSTTEGGGIYIDAGINSDPDASVEVLQSTIAGNVAGNLGGGVFSSGDGTFSMKSSKVTQNAAAGGGGLYLINSTVVTISGGLIAQNYSDSSGGGIVSGLALELSGTKIIGNIATTSGGGIHSTGRLDLMDCRVSANLAVLGGGIFQQSTEPLSIIRTKVEGNISNDGKQVVDA